VFFVYFVDRPNGLGFGGRRVSSHSESIPADARRSLLVYNFFFPLVFLALLPGFLVRMFRRGGFRSRFGQRLSLYRTEDRARLAAHRWIWVHSISVGETFLALKLARQIHAERPEARILLSTTTTTGFALVKENATDWLEPLYNPVDFLPIVRRALDLLRPERILLIEGEAWPNLLAESRRRGIPVSLANARLSPRSERRFRRFRAWTGPIFRLLEKVTVPEQEDIARWEGLGVSAEKLHCTGSIKFDQPAGAVSRTEEFRGLLASAGIEPSAPLIVAGSTHDGEEKILAEMLPELRRSAPALRLVITPRHAERTPAILRDLAPLPVRIVRRTELSRATAGEPCDLVLIDTTGELRDWYTLADVVFVGKSLTAVGGQNPAEPALLGKAVVFGPHMENFQAVVEHLLAHDAAVQAPDAAGVCETLGQLLADRTRCARLAQNARAALAAHSGATARAAALLLG
jgi:3-deoxy-D-manno-octulosonic-acid transferase